jgi:hypothetical protein
MKRIALVLAGVALSEPAWALDYWMWGIGPKVGTTFLPGRYPIKFPNVVEDDLVDDPNDDADPPGQIPSINKVGGDFIAGFNATYYASSSTRLGIDAGFDLGQSFFGANFMLEYNWVKQSSALDFLLGAEAGAGTMVFNGIDPAKLRVNTFPVRAESGLVIRDNSRAYQGSLYYQFDIPSRQIFTPSVGDTLDGGVGIGLYMSLGIEVTLMFGDFTPPRPKNGGGAPPAGG